MNELLVRCMRWIWGRGVKRLNDAAGERSASCALVPVQFINQSTLAAEECRALQRDLNLTIGTYTFGQAATCLLKYSDTPGLFATEETDEVSRDYLAALKGPYRGLTLVFYAS